VHEPKSERAYVDLGAFALRHEALARMPNSEKRPTDEQQKAKALSRWENEGGAKAMRPKRPRGLNPGSRNATGEVDRHPRFTRQRNANE
jgi:hypothetical protein